MNKEEFNFESSFQRLETILEKMNSGNVTLDESLKLYEEADTLIAGCTQKLNSVEQRIEVLIKKRNGELELNDENTPQVEAFMTSEEAT